MENEQSDMTATQSLDIITRMIREAQGNIRKNSFYYLLWGWVVALANLGVFVLLLVGVPNPYWVWLIALPAWAFTMFRGFREGRNSRARTHLDRINGMLWMMFGFTIFCIIFFGYKINFQINPIIMLVSAIPTFASGIIIRFRPLIMGGISFLVMGVICFLVPWQMQFLIGALAVAIGFLVPGYMIKNAKVDV